MEIGRILAERYEIVRPLAEGAMSTVWVAKDRSEGEEVAIKAISLDAAGWRAEVRDRFTKEARLLALGKHENLVGVRDVGETDDGFLYLVLDLLVGETLADRIEREPPLGWMQASSLALAITRGVAALHRVGIVHRDLKPANIVLQRTSAGEVPKIIDLGISKVRAAAADPELCATLTATGQVLGTPQYMSYEQALGDADVDARSDVWALGVILYEMLTRRRPFEAPNANAVLAAIRRKEAPSLTGDIPEPIVALVDRCLQTSREARFSDAGELSIALEAAIEASRLDATPRAFTAPEKPAPEPPRESARSPRRFVAIGGLSLLVALATGLLVWRLTKRNEHKPDSSPPSSTATGVALAPPVVTSAMPDREPPRPSDSAMATPKEGPRITTTASSAPRITNPGLPADHVPAPTPSGKAPLTKVNSAGF